jgi:glyoxylase-like metal-dependent hydrolase (beta-lactamase superfamily II)
MTSRPEVQSFFDEATSTVTHLVHDPATRAGAIIDPVLDFDPRSGKVSTRSADAVLAAAQEKGLRVEWILETHAHADHLTAAPYLKSKTAAKVGIGAHIRDVQRIFRPVFNLDDVSGDGSEFDHLFEDGERFRLGELELEVLHTPGHTPACISYRAGDAVFVGDTLFMPDYGTARADFPGGSATALYRSIQRLYALPEETRVFLCHDYPGPGRSEPAWETTIGAQRRHNVQAHGRVSEAEFVAMRNARDATLAAPNLLLPSIQVNIRAGKLPRPESNGTRYLKIPLRMAEPLGAALPEKAS